MASNPLTHGGVLQMVLPLIVIVAALALVRALFSALSGAGGAGIPPVRRVPLMTPAERRTLGYIEQALPWARVHAQVSMGALLAPKKGLNRSEATTVRNRFSSKRVDYVIEDRASGSVVMLIELDDASHRADQDARRDRMTGSAGYFTLRLPASERPSLQGVRNHLADAFERQPQLQPAGARAQRGARQQEYTDGAR
jgi:hypothetical protein